MTHCEHCAFYLFSVQVNCEISKYNRTHKQTNRPTEKLQNHTNDWNHIKIKTFREKLDQYMRLIDNYKESKELSEVEGATGRVVVTGSRRSYREWKGTTGRVGVTESGRSYWESGRSYRVSEDAGWWGWWSWRRCPSGGSGPPSHCFGSPPLQHAAGPCLHDINRYRY